MSNYIKFPMGADEAILVEVDAVDLAVPAGVEKAGLRDLVRGTTGAVASSKTDFSEAVESGVDRVARAMETAVSRLDRIPTEVEVAFGLKATGEVGNFAIAKVSAEANFEVRLKWVTSVSNEKEAQS